MSENKGERERKTDRRKKSRKEERKERPEGEGARKGEKGRQSTVVINQRCAQTEDEAQKRTIR